MRFTTVRLDSGALHTRWHTPVADPADVAAAVARIESWWSHIWLIRRRADESRRLLAALLQHRDHYFELQRYPGVRREWRKCPEDWISMMREPDAEATLARIVDECVMGLWDA